MNSRKQLPTCLLVGLFGVAAGLGACGNDDDVPADTGSDAADQDASDASIDVIDVNEGGTVVFAPYGAIAAPAGLGSFAFGAATAASQIEDQNTAVDWYFWTLPEADGGLGNSEPLGEASRGFSNAIADVAIMQELNLDTYRFSVEWARVEPARDEVDQDALDHYGAFIDAMLAADIEPNVTMHHFSNPLWVDNFVDGNCPNGVTDTDLCGWGSEEGAPLIIDELVEHARLLAETYGDRVDNWGTFNEPVNYLLASYGTGVFPPGRNFYLSDTPRFIAIVRNVLEAHARMYDAIHEADTIDADGDGVAASVGLTLSVIDWDPARDNAPSDNPEDIAATDRVRYVYHYLFPDAFLEGGFDADLDQTLEEPHDDWAGRLDWLGVQYYFRAGVSGQQELFPILNATVCAQGFDFGACIPPVDDTHWVPSMGYEYFEEGLYTVLTEFSERYPDLPMTVSEAGIATEVGERRAENVVRSLEQIARAIQDGVDVRGYYHWSLIDNFEWAEGYEPKFGLYTVDYDGDYSRTPTLGATVLGEIAGNRTMTEEHRTVYGGTGPMTPEE